MNHVYRLEALWRHLLGLLIVWPAKRDDSLELDAHGKEAVNQATNGPATIWIAPVAERVLVPRD